jgi:hypothetical protein
MLVEFEIRRNVSEKLLRELETRIRHLLASDVERQTASRLTELRNGGETCHPLRISIDLQHPPSEMDLGCGRSLLITEGQRLSRAEVIEVIWDLVPPELVEDVRVDGRSWNDLRETPDQQVVDNANME